MEWHLTRQMLMCNYMFWLVKQKILSHNERNGYIIEPVHYIIYGI